MQVFVLQSIRLELFAEQVALGDLDLFDLGIAADADDFQAVEQRRRQRVQHVGRGDEKHVAEIVFDAQIMILESVVLLGVEHFHQRGGRVAAEIG